MCYCEFYQVLNVVKQNGQQVCLLPNQSGTGQHSSMFQHIGGYLSHGQKYFQYIEEEIQWLFFGSRASDRMGLPGFTRQLGATVDAAAATFVHMFF